MAPQMAIDRDKISAFCRKWKVKELALFGSVLREDFGPDSDVDVLVSFEADAAWNLWDHHHMNEELQEILGRKVDLVTRPAVERSPNWIRRKAILESAETIYG